MKYRIEVSYYGPKSFEPREWRVSVFNASGMRVMTEERAYSRKHGLRIGKRLAKEHARRARLRMKHETLEVTV